MHTHTVGNVSMSMQELIDNVIVCVNPLMETLPSQERLKRACPDQPTPMKSTKAKAKQKE
jgi:ribosomal protein L1